MAEPMMRGVFKFGSYVIPRAQVFLITPLSFAFTNRKPILPGRILTTPPVTYTATCQNMFFNPLVTRCPSVHKEAGGEV